VDGATHAANAGNGGHTPPLQLAPGVYTVSETAAAGTNLNNYTTTIGGDCAADGKVTINYGDDKTCTITNRAAPRLTVVMELSPANDAGRFDLRIDGVTKASNVGNNGSTQAQIVSAGNHHVTEAGASGTSLANYHATFSGDCSASGIVTLAPGESKTCVISNQRKGPVCFSMCTSQDEGCTAGCKSSRDQCMKNAGKDGEPLPKDCAQEFKQCNAGCATELNQCNAKCK
jgi:hypothetical protein